MIDCESILTWEYKPKERKRYSIPHFFGKRYIAVAGPSEIIPGNLLPHVIGVFEDLGKAGDTAMRRAEIISETTSERAWYGVYDLAHRQIVCSGTLGDFSGC